MKIVSGLESFKNIVQFNNEKDKYPYWKKYYHQFEDVFEVLFHKLYRSNVQNFQDVINMIDFNELEWKAEQGLMKHPFNEIKEKLLQCTGFFRFEGEFNLFLMVGLGHIDGAAPPSKHSFIYLGLERLEGVDLDLLIPHEFNHLVRFHSADEDFSDMTVKQLVIAEGLATLTPLVMQNQPLTRENIIRALMIPEEDYDHLEDKRVLLQEEISKDLNQLIGESMMQKYFMANENAQMKKSGYYFGAFIIQVLLNEGEDLKVLTTQTTEEVFALFYKISGS